MIISGIVAVFLAGFLPDSLQSKKLADSVVVQSSRLFQFETDAALRWTSSAGGPAAPGVPLASQLALLPGAFAADREHLSVGERLTVRGTGWRANFGVRGVHVRYNGLPLTMPDGQTILSVLDPDQITAQTFAPASSGLLWGSASNGTLELQDFNTETAAPQLTGMAGAFGFRKVLYRTSIPSKDGTTHLRLSYQEQDGYRQNSRSEIVRYSVSDVRFLNGVRHSWHVFGEYAPELANPGTLRLDEFEQNPRQANPAFLNMRAGKTSSLTTAGYVMSTIKMDGGIWGNVRNLENPLPFAGITLNRQAGGFWLTARDSIGTVAVSGGLDAATQLDWRTERLVRSGRITDTLLTDQREQFSSGGFYLSAEQSVGNLTLRAGARVSPASGVLRPKDAERKAVTYFPILPSTGVFYVIGPAMLFTTFQTGYDTPTLNEWSAPQTTETAAQKLLPERSRTLEAGASITTAQHRIRLAVYNMTVSNRIGTFESAVLPGAVLYRNEGKSFHRGAEVSMELFASSPIRFQQQLSYGRYTFAGGAFDGKQLPGVPKLHAGSQLSYVSPLFHIQLLHHFSTARFADSNNTVRVDGFSVWNARVAANLPFGGRQLLNIFLAGFNLGNARYSPSIAVNANAARYYEPAAPRNFRIGIAMRF